MSDEKATLSALKGGLKTVHNRLRGITSLARCKVPSRRNFLAKELLNSLGEMQEGELDEVVEDFMNGGCPDARHVQTLLQILIESRNLSCIDTVLASIELRVTGHFASSFRSRLHWEAAREDAWWGDSCLQPFEDTMPKKNNLRKRVRHLLKVFHEYTEKTSV